MNPQDTQAIDRAAQYRGHETAHAESGHINRMSRATHGRSVSAETQTKYDTWSWGKNPPEQQHTITVPVGNLVGVWG